MTQGKWFSYINGVSACSFWPQKVSPLSRIRHYTRKVLRLQSILNEWPISSIMACWCIANHHLDRTDSEHTPNWYSRFSCTLKMLFCYFEPETCGNKHLNQHRPVSYQLSALWLSCGRSHDPLDQDLCTSHCCHGGSYDLYCRRLSHELQAVFVSSLPSPPAAGSPSPQCDNPKQLQVWPVSEWNRGERRCWVSLSGEPLFRCFVALCIAGPIAY